MISWIDIIIFIVILRFAFVGYRRGGVGELILTVGFIALCFLLYHFYSPIGDILNSFLKIPSQYSNFVSYGLFVVGGLLLLWLISKVLTAVIDVGFLGVINKFFGIAVGGVKGAILCSLGLYTAVIFNFKFLLNLIPESSWSNKYIVNLAPNIYEIIKGFI